MSWLEDETRLLSVAQASLRVRRHPTRIYKWIGQGKLATVKQGRETLVGENQLLELEKELRGLRGRPRRNR